MKQIFILAGFIFISCHLTSKSIEDKGKIVVIKKQGDKDSTSIRGSIIELSTGDKLKLSDIWINNQRHACDTMGNFQIVIKPGKYKIEARSFGFTNFKHDQLILRGEIVNLTFYLVPYSNEKASKFTH